MPGGCLDGSQSVHGRWNPFGIAGFRRDRPDDSFRGWLWTITRSKIQDAFRARAKQPGAPGGTAAQQRLLEISEAEPPSEVEPPSEAAPSGRLFDDPSWVIPVRLRKRTPLERYRLFAAALAGFLEVNAGRYPTLLALAEPGLAALMFYGLVRLVPRGALQNTLGFSTFEPRLDRAGRRSSTSDPPTARRARDRR